MIQTNKQIILILTDNKTQNQQYDITEACERLVQYFSIFAVVLDLHMSESTRRPVEPEVDSQQET